MELSFFTDLIEAIGKVTDGIKSIVSLPKSEREKYRQTMDDTYRLIDTTLNMIIIRLGDIALLPSDNDFLQEVTKLDNYTDWMTAEREFRLCKSLRVALSETETLSTRFTGWMSTKDWDSLLELMRSVLASEGEIANFIGEKFFALANSVRISPMDASAVSKLREQLSTLRTSLIKERQQLIQQEIELYGLV